MKRMLDGFRSHAAHAIGAFAVLVAMLLGAGSALADDPLCISPWLTGTSGAPAPTVDGGISGDPGYKYAAQYSFPNGSSLPDGVMQVLRMDNTLYFSFEVNNDPEFNDDDLIILLLGPVANDPTQDWRIHIKPVSGSGGSSTAGTGSANLPASVQAWQDSSTWANRFQTPDVTDPSWLNVKVTANSAGTSVSYRVEAALDIGASGMAFPSTTGQFKMHFNVLRLYTSTVGGVTETDVMGQLNWPSNAFIPGQGNPTDTQIFNNPARANWGDVLVDSGTLWGTSTACNGVRVKNVWLNYDPTNTSVLNTPTPTTNATNTYHINVENTGSANAGNVLATIKASIFGITPFQGFGPVPATPQPLPTYSGAHPGPLAPGSVQEIGPATWVASYSQYQQLIGLSPYVCSFVQLDVDNAHNAGVTRTLIANRYFYWNTHFAHASRFEHAAVLNTKGFGKRLDGGTTQRFHLFVSDREVVSRDARESQSDRRIARVPYAQVSGEIAMVGGNKFYEKGAAFLSKTVCGARDTGGFIRINGKNARLMERTPCFAYWIYHPGVAIKWTDVLLGEGLKQWRPNAYSIALPAGKSTKLVTRIEAFDPPCRCAPRDIECRRRCG